MTLLRMGGHVYAIKSPSSFSLEGKPTLSSVEGVGMRLASVGF
jgi:hypothetical protein